MNALRFLSIREFGPVRPSGETDFDGGDLGVESSLSGSLTPVDSGTGCGAGNTVTADAASCVLGWARPAFILSYVFKLKRTNT